MCDDDSEITLTSNEGVNVTVLYKYIKMSDTIKHVCEDTRGVGNIPLPEINSATLHKLIEYIVYHVDNDNPTINPEQRSSNDVMWDTEYVKVPQTKLFELILAANYLAISPLLDLICKTVANMIKGKTPEQIREIFGIENDFTPEEEEVVRRENDWCEN